MSIIFGERRERDKQVSLVELRQLATATERYAEDGIYVSANARIGMVFQPNHTHDRSTLEREPLVDAYRNMIALDGRLDNYQELATCLDLNSIEHSDSAIILAAFRKWGEDCFSRLTGDWAIALWSEKEQILYLARDHAGARNLYFEQSDDVLRWSTYLDTFFVTGRRRALERSYAARYLGCQPIGDVTPYQGIYAVPPAHYVAFSGRTQVLKAHWNWVARNEIFYRSDAEYEEHFLSLFSQSVRRRTGKGSPILAQLSGGMDSTSIVCMSDRIRSEDGTETDDLLDSISYYDNSESSWNERPYFLAVEAARGKTGLHIETTFRHRSFEPWGERGDRYFFPGTDSATIQNEQDFLDSVGHKNYRSIVSGIGGDEVLGGVPSPLPELATYLSAGQIRTLAKKTLLWSLHLRRPFAHVLFETARFSVRAHQAPGAENAKLANWLSSEMQQICREASHSYYATQGLRRCSPVAASNGSAWWSIMETLPHLQPAFLKRYEYRYPYLDRDLVDFLFRIPREQLIRPGRRRCLMRRALKNIVPEEVLERRRKAYISRSPLVTLQRFREKIVSLFADSVLEELGWVDGSQLRAGVNNAIEKGDPTWMLPVMRAISLELWLRSVYLHPSTVEVGPEEISVLRAG